MAYDGRDAPKSPARVRWEKAMNVLFIAAVVLFVLSVFAGCTGTPRPRDPVGSPTHPSAWMDPEGEWVSMALVKECIAEGEKYAPSTGLNLLLVVLIPPLGLVHGLGGMAASLSTQDACMRARGFSNR